MKIERPSRPRIRALAFAAFVLLSTPACAPDDPITETTEREPTWPLASTTYPYPNSGAFADSSADQRTRTSERRSSDSSSSTTITTTTTLSVVSTSEPPTALKIEYRWGERSDSVLFLQRTLGIIADGIYGPVTRQAHATALVDLGLPTDAVPDRPDPVSSAPSRSDDDVPPNILERVQNLWPADEWDRALAVARCESNYRVDAANPTSSARGVFQLLAPWTRNPGSGRSVWGWLYDADGEKLSAAAGLGISESDARLGYGNIVVAYEIWRHSGWGPWTASQSCWGRR